MDVWPLRYVPGWLESVSLAPYDSRPFSEHRFSFWAFLREQVPTDLTASSQAGELQTRNIYLQAKTRNG